MSKPRKPLSEEHKRKLSIAMKGRVFSAETLKKMSKAQKGKKMPPVTKETRRKLSEAGKGRVVSEETKIKISNSEKGKIVSKETRIKLGISKRKDNLSDETRRKMRESKLKRVEKLLELGQPLYPAIGKNEPYILDAVEKEFNISLFRQYHVCGYFIDGYDFENKIAYEIDEKYHMSEAQIIKDNYRQRIIENELGCNFIRIEDNRNGN